MSADTLERLVREDPLAHPLPFSIRHNNHEYPPPDHLREMVGAVFRGMSPRYPNAPKNVCRLYPREHGKSQTADNDLLEWAICRNPSIRILLMMETSGQAKDKMAGLKDSMGVDDGTAVEGGLADHYDLTVKKDTSKKLTFHRSETHDEPTVTATGFNTGVTGGHYDLLVYDDIVSWKTQRTESRRKKAWRQFSDYSQNLGSQGDSTHLVIGTRKHPRDIYSRLIDSVGWDTRVAKAIEDWSVVENRDYNIVSDAGNRYSPNELGEMKSAGETMGRVEPTRDVDVLWPARWPLDKLLRNYISSMTEDGEGSLVWKRENQNDAEALQGQVLSEGMLFFTDRSEWDRLTSEENLQWYAGVDLGVEEDPDKAASGDSDYWAVAIGAYHPRTEVTHVVDINRRRGMSLDAGIKWVKGALRPYEVFNVLVEGNQAQRWFTQTAREEGLNFEKTTSTGSKEDRIIDASSAFESGRVRLVEGEKGNDNKWQSFISEWASFPTGSHDDRLDAVEIMMRNVGTGKVTTSNHGMGDLPVG